MPGHITYDTISRNSSGPLGSYAKRKFCIVSFCLVLYKTHADLELNEENNLLASL